ncbi:unnamed protein product [Ilex paraguariensis]|uniref:Bifunctional inhibitor/plant lipid transfer protein/seed storage helical domain-containing protein n=1 Tax=Ilex paraguariensis TaxID=185542 RepID=A0ABC8UUC8_9AQUA
MSILSFRVSALAMLMVAGILISGDKGVSAQDCSDDIQGLILNCQRYVIKLGPKIPPPAACCDVVKSANLACVCSHVTPAIEKFVSIEKVLQFHQWHEMGIAGEMPAARWTYAPPKSKKNPTNIERGRKKIEKRIMAILSFRVSALAMLMVAGILISEDMGVSALDCSVDIQRLISNCKRYVIKLVPKIPPSAACCGVVKSANFTCVCSHVTPAITKFVSIEKVLYVAKTCGLTLTSGMKCGSFTVPPVV